jgi:uncharacterized phage-like protein YoqJ
MEKTNKVICFTGYRIQFVKQYKTGIDHYLKNRIAIAKQEGSNIFISGMALGVDQWAAQQVLNDPQLNLICAIPCLEHYKKWSSDSKLDWFKIILSKRSELGYVSNQPYFYNCMDALNRWMIDHSDGVIGVWTWQKGGTKNCLDYARRQKKEIWFYDPIRYRQLYWNPITGQLEGNGSK